MRVHDLIAPVLSAAELEELDAANESGGNPESVTVAAITPAASVGELGRLVVGRTRLHFRTRRSSRSGESTTRLKWPAGSGNRVGRAARIRSHLLAGRISIERGSADTPFEVALRDLGATSKSGLHIGSGGGMRVLAEISGQPSIVRFGRVGSPADPRHHFAALEALERLPETPSAIKSGCIGDVAWAAEGHIGGSSPRRVDATVIDAANRFLAELPTSTAIRYPFDELAELHQISDDVWSSLAPLADEVRQRLNGLTGVLTHGDFWVGNLMFQGPDLTGVVDWDAWTPAGPPGHDLLHLMAEDLRRRRRTDYGTLVASRFWREESVRRALVSHLDTGSVDTEDRLEALGMTWWIGAVANAVRRNPSLAESADWLNRNVRAPLQSASNR